MSEGPKKERKGKFVGDEDEGNAIMEAFRRAASQKDKKPTGEQQPDKPSPFKKS